MQGSGSTPVVLEIILGIGVALPWFRKEAALGLTPMLIVLYWANLNMWVNEIPLNGRVYENHWHILRGAGQILLILISLWLCAWETGNRFSSQLELEDIVEVG